MRKDDLTQVKNIGSARKKLLAIHGITTVQQLYDIPLDELMQIKSLGQHYAKLIKEAVNDLYETRKATPAEAVADGSREREKKSDTWDRKLKAEFTKTTKYLKRTKEKFKPIKKKKHLKLFVEFKRQSNKLKTHINILRRHQLDISKKQKKKIAKQAAHLNMILKNTGKTKKGKTMKKLSQEIQSLLSLISN